MIIIKNIIQYFIQIRHTDDFPSTGTRLVTVNITFYEFFLALFICMFFGDFFIYFLYIFTLSISLFLNLLCIGAFEQSRLEPWRCRNAFVIIAGYFYAALYC